MYFKDKEHENFYTELIKLYSDKDPYYNCLYYLFGLTEDTRKNFNRVFDVVERKIKPQGLNEPWQTGTTIAITRLAFNLFNGFTGFDGKYDDIRNYTVENTFYRKELVKYFFQAIAIRFEL